MRCKKEQNGLCFVHSVSVTHKEERGREYLIGEEGVNTVQRKGGGSFLMECCRGHREFVNS